MATTYKSRFGFGDKVILDGDKSLVAVVIAILWRSSQCQIEVAWIHAGDAKSSYVDEWRLSLAE